MIPGISGKVIINYKIKKDLAIAKVIEVIATSTEGFEDATKNALKEASKTVKNIEPVYV